MRELRIADPERFNAETLAPIFYGSETADVARMVIETRTRFAIQDSLDKGILSTEPDPEIDILRKQNELLCKFVQELYSDWDESIDGDRIADSFERLHTQLIRDLKTLDEISIAL